MMNQKDWEASIAWSKIAAGCIVRNDEGKFLMVQEKQQKAYGLWNIPAGYVDRGESIEDAAVRETKEETGYDVKLIEKLEVYHEAVEIAVRHAYIAEIIGGEIVIDEDEILDVQWFSFDEISKMHRDGKLRHEWIFDAITRLETRLENQA